LPNAALAQGYFPGYTANPAAYYAAAPYNAYNPYQGYRSNRGVRGTFRRLSPTVRSTLTGAAIGGGAGLVTGLIAGRGRALKGTLIGAGVGAAAGLGLGMLRNRGVGRFW
jgi:hypothetical protein